MSEFNRLEDGRYFDVESQTSFEVDHVTQVRGIRISWGRMGLIKALVE